jgi:hypothetical protein
VTDRRRLAGEAKMLLNIAGGRHHAGRPVVIANKIEKLLLTRSEHFEE